MASGVTCGACAQAIAGGDSSQRKCKVRVAPHHPRVVHEQLYGCARQVYNVGTHHPASRSWAGRRVWQPVFVKIQAADRIDAETTGIWRKRLYKLLPPGLFFGSRSKCAAWANALPLRQQYRDAPDCLVRELESETGVASLLCKGGGCTPAYREARRTDRAGSLPLEAPTSRRLKVNSAIEALVGSDMPFPHFTFHVECTHCFRLVRCERTPFRRRIRTGAASKEIAAGHDILACALD
ncbi:unnamed protein product [Symbiodinium sp. CCMP2592]|nr:unnamed protein product [Symbiodinium sp. CCMP2592]